MNCRQAESHLLAARDEPLAEPVAGALAQHLETCPACRRLATQLNTALDDWKTQTATVRVPDPQTEWHAVRRRIRQTADAPSALTAWSRLLRVAAPLTAVAAIAFVVWQARTPTGQTPAAPELTAPKLASEPASATFDGTWPEMDNHFAFSARADYVETDDPDASPFVYVDDESGWLIVWASDPPEAAATRG